MLRQWTSLGILALASVFVPGCTTKACTEIGCGTPLRVNFVGATDVPGRYRVDLVADGVATTCEVTTDSSTPPTCSGANVLWRIDMYADQPGGVVRVHGFYLWSGTPASIDFVVYRDDKIVGGDNF
ncbi:MAG: hypothetical protein ABW133_01090, partial [Polyangiaceae bacterium]